MSPRGEPPLEPESTGWLAPECPKCCGPLVIDFDTAECADEDCGWTAGAPEPPEDRMEDLEW